MGMTFDLGHIAQRLLVEVEPVDEREIDGAAEQRDELGICEEVVAGGRDDDGVRRR